MTDPKNCSKNELLHFAKSILRGTRGEPGAVFVAAKRLAGMQYMEYARRLAKSITDDKRLDLETAREVRQKWALWTPKIPTCPTTSSMTRLWKAWTASGPWTAQK